MYMMSTHLNWYILGLHLVLGAACNGQWQSRPPDIEGQHLPSWRVYLDYTVLTITSTGGDDDGCWMTHRAHLHTRARHGQLLAVYYATLKWRVGHWLVIKLDTQQMRSNFLWLEIDLELGIAFRLDIVWHIFPGNRDDNLKVPRPSLGGVDGEVDWLADGAGLDVRHHHTAGLVCFHYKRRALDMQPSHLDLDLMVPHHLWCVVHLILPLAYTSDAAGHNLPQRREDFYLRVTHVSLTSYHEACLPPHRYLLEPLPGQVHLGSVHH